MEFQFGYPIQIANKKTINFYKTIIMKTKLLFIFALFTMALSYGQQTLPFYEKFDYAVGGPLANATPLNKQWTSVTLATILDDQIVDSPGWATTGIPGYGGNALFIQGGSTDPQILLTSQTTGTVYYSFLLKISENTNSLTPWTNTVDSQNYFICLGNDSGTGGTNYLATLWVKRNDASGTGAPRIGLTRTAAAAEVVYSPTVYAMETEYYIVASYTFDAVTPVVKCWIFPTGESIPTTEPTATIVNTNGTSIRPNIDRVYIRQHSNANTPGMVIDELRVAKSWSEVIGSVLGTKSNEISELKAYPNPVYNGKLSISSATNGEKKITVFSVTGQKVLEAKTNNNAEINVSKLTKGTYVLKINENGTTATKKLIIN